MKKLISEYERNPPVFSEYDKKESGEKPVWYSGEVHFHTTFSDGSDNIPQRAIKAKSYGCSFAVATDHYGQINSLDKEPAQKLFIANPSGFDKGFGDYIRNCQEQTSLYFVMIPGAEISSPWHAEVNTEDSSHTLTLGPIIQDQTLDQLENKSNSQAEIIKNLNKIGLLSVAAHPRLIVPGKIGLVPWEQTRYRYDIRMPETYSGIQGIEFFNQDKKQDKDTLSWYCQLIKKGNRVFVTSGNDSHGWDKLFNPVGSKDSEKWNHITWIYTDKLTPKGILDAFNDGQTYASRGFAELTYMSHFPCNSLIPQEFPPKFKFNLEFIKRNAAHKGKNLKSPAKLSFVMYRDGNPMSQSCKTFAKNTTRCVYSWTDINAAKGKHIYFLWIDGYLITSPFCIMPKE